MNYPKNNLIQGVLFLLGLYPLQEKQQLRWQDKVNVLGTLLSIYHCCITIYMYKVEIGQKGVLSSSPNNIIHSTVLLRRLLAVTIPILSIVSRFCNIRSLEIFWEKVQVFDRFLWSSVQKEKFLRTEQRIRRVNFFAGLFVIAVECFNISCFGLYYLLVSAVNSPALFKIYFFDYASTVYSCGAMYIFSRIYGLTLRLECLCGFVEEIWDEIRASNSEYKPRGSRRLSHPFAKEQFLPQ